MKGCTWPTIQWRRITCPSLTCRSFLGHRMVASMYVVHDSDCGSPSIIPYPTSSTIGGWQPSGVPVWAGDYWQSTSRDAKHVAVYANQPAHSATCHYVTPVPSCFATHLASCPACMVCLQHVVTRCTPCCKLCGCSHEYTECLAAVTVVVQASCLTRKLMCSPSSPGISRVPGVLGSPPQSQDGVSLSGIQTQMQGQNKRMPTPTTSVT